MSTYSGILEDPTLQELELNHISFEWIQKTDRVNYLKKAMRLLKNDGDHFPALSKALENKLVLVDPAFKRYLRPLLIGFKNRVSMLMLKHIIENLINYFSFKMR